MSEGDFPKHTSSEDRFKAKVLQELISVSALDKEIESLFKFTRVATHRDRSSPSKNELLFCWSFSPGEEARLFRLDGFQCSPPAELTRLLNASLRGERDQFSRKFPRNKENQGHFNKCGSVSLFSRLCTLRATSYLKFDGITLLGKCNV